MRNDPPRSRAARAAAERALIRIVHHYGARPDFVLLGGLVPELLCSTAGLMHAGTTDVDVQVNLEIAAGSVNSARLEQALFNAEFEPDAAHVWRWRTNDGVAVIMAKCAAAHGRRKPKDWYDIAYVLLHNDAGGVDAAAAAVRTRFGSELGSLRTALDDLRDNFAAVTAQGAAAYADEVIGNHPELDRRTLLADASIAVGWFHEIIGR